MRTTPLNGILTSLATNFSRRNKDVRLYEIGNIYLAKEQPLTELPDERKKLTLGMYGEGDFYTMKGVVELLLERVGIEDKPVYSTKTEIPYDHPGRRAAILIGGTEVGEIGEIHPKVMKNYGLGERTYVAVLDLKNLIPLTSFDRKYKGLAKYPAVFPLSRNHFHFCIFPIIPIASPFCPSSHQTLQTGRRQALH